VPAHGREKTPLRDMNKVKGRWHKARRRTDAHLLVYMRNMAVL
jgi:hypothetical protein